jgi:hypothetical protein
MVSRLLFVIAFSLTFTFMSDCSHGYTYGAPAAGGGLAFKLIRFYLTRATENSRNAKLRLTLYQEDVANDHEILRRV